MPSPFLKYKKQEDSTVPMPGLLSCRRGFLPSHLVYHAEPALSRKGNFLSDAEPPPVLPAKYRTFSKQLKGSHIKLRLFRKSLQKAPTLEAKTAASKRRSNCNTSAPTPVSTSPLIITKTKKEAQRASLNVCFNISHDILKLVFHFTSGQTFGFLNCR